MKKFLILAIVIAAGATLVGCKDKEAEQAKRLAPFVPEGYTILSKTAGNLNLDKFEDMLLIVERKEETIGEEWIEEDRILMILLGQKGGKYEFAAKNDKVVFHSNAGGSFTNEPLDSVGIKDGEFSVKMMGGSRELWTNAITFKYSREDKNWYLYSDAEEVIDRLDPDNITATLKMAEDFGRVSFAKYKQADGQTAQTSEEDAEVDFDKLALKDDVFYLNDEPFTGTARIAGIYNGGYIEMKDGKVHGKYEEDLGNVVIHGTFKDGKKHGEWKYFKEQTLRETEIYEDDKLIEKFPKEDAAEAANTFPQEQQEYRLFQELHGDLNGDGKDDYVVIIKGTDTAQIVKDENSGEPVDRNRRGILISFNNGNGILPYQRVLENRSCFASENEDGGTYFPPELSVSVKKGNLYIDYNWGKYGQWKYTFRYRNGEFVLIGYDVYSREMPDNYSAEGEEEREIEVVETESSYNLLTKKVFVKSVFSYTDGGSKKDEKWGTFVVNRLVKLTDIQDFSEFDRGFDLYVSF